MNVQIKNLDMASEVQVYDNFLDETDLNKLENLLKQLTDIDNLIKN